MLKGKVLCSIGTRGRYDTTLPLALESIIMQTKRPDKLVIFDDNDAPRDLRNEHIYQNLFQMLSLKGIDWEVIFGEKKGPHFNHQKANLMGYEWVWRMDDDAIAEPDVLEKLWAQVGDDVGGVAGSILTPPFTQGIKSTGKIDNVNVEQNVQWDYINEVKEVDHLHCSFLYRAGVHDYNLALSRVAHREETLFTYGLKLKGYRLLVVPAVTWHLKNQAGGIRGGQEELYLHDERIFNNIVKLRDRTIVVLDSGLGDHIMFKSMASEIKDPVIFSCYPEVVPGGSIAEAKALLGDIEPYNIYRKCDEWNWKSSLVDAYRRLYT